MKKLLLLLTLLTTLTSAFAYNPLKETNWHQYHISTSQGTLRISFTKWYIVPTYGLESGATVGSKLNFDFYPKNSDVQNIRVEMSNSYKGRIDAEYLTDLDQMFEGHYNAAVELPLHDRFSLKLWENYKQEIKIFIDGEESVFEIELNKAKEAH